MIPVASKAILLAVDCRVKAILTMNGLSSSDKLNPYALERSSGPPPGKPESSIAGSMDYSEQIDEGSSYVAASSIVTGGFPYYHDATATVHEMHLALLYLLSNPEEFQRALQSHPPRGATTLQEWNAEYESDTITDVQGEATTPLPFVVFADDAEVVLPQAHTASQLFGIERVEGIELEAAAGVPALSQLFLRWLAIMPSGDHLNIIDPPGLTVMRIAGGRYRVTAAHRVVWTWMNEFASLSHEEINPEDRLQVGDLVTMTIVDVFETDNNGKLLSYCPTFDNRRVHKTSATNEAMRKSSAKIMSRLSIMSNSHTAAMVNQSIGHVANLGISAAKSVATSVQRSVNKQLENIGSSPSRQATPKPGVSAKDFEVALQNEEAKMNLPSTQVADVAVASSDVQDDKPKDGQLPGVPTVGSSLYFSDDSTIQGGEAK